MNKKKNAMTMEQKIANSKFDIVKKSLYFLIVPILILLVGIILVSTVGFSKGIDFTGAQTFKVYVNNESKLTDAIAYDLNDKEDYNSIYEKITVVLKNNNVKVISYQTTDVNLAEYDVYGGQAVQVTYQTIKESKESSIIRAELIDAFGYENYDGAISTIDEVPPVSTFGWFIGLTAGVMFGLVAAIIYLSIRFSKSAFLVVFMQTALDILLTLALLLVCRVSINLTVGIIVLTAFILSIINSFTFYNKVRENKKSGIYEGVTNVEMANKATKQIAFKKAILYVGAILISLVFVILSVSAVRAVALGIMLALLATFYTSTFILPTFWAIADKPKKEKKKV